MHFISNSQHLEGDSALNRQPMQLLQHVDVFTGALLLAWLHCSGHAATVRHTGRLCNLGGVAVVKARGGRVGWPHFSRLQLLDSAVLLTVDLCR